MPDQATKPKKPLSKTRRVALEDALMLGRETLDFYDDTPEKWTKGHFAVNEHGHTVEIYDPTAARFCIVGGITRVTTAHQRNPRRHLVGRWFKGADELMSALKTVLTSTKKYRLSLMSFNDHPKTTFEDIKTVLQQGVGLLEAELTPPPAVEEATKTEEEPNA